MELFTRLGLRTCCVLLLTLFSVVCGQEEPPCDCVPYFLCQGPNGTITTDGSDLIDIKSGFSNRAGRQCEDPLARCCTIPPEFRITTTTTSTAPPPPETPPVDIGGGTTTTTTTAIPPIPPSVIVPSGLCGVRRELPTASRILNDNGVSTGATYYAEFPWMIAVLTEERLNENVHYKFKCGGSLIIPNIVITAAHCVVGVDQNLLNIRAGEWDTQSRDEPMPHQDRRVASIVVHPEFNPKNLRNDIAVIILESAYNITDNVDMVCLPPSLISTNFEQSRCVATGWGKNSLLETGEYQQVLKKVDLAVVPPDQCQARLRNTRLGPYFLLHDSFTCAGGEPGRDTCQGDGGGPLFCPLPQDNSRWAQVGITSWGIGCGDGNPAVYTNVVNFVTWIIEQIPLPSDTNATF